MAFNNAEGFQLPIQNNTLDTARFSVDKIVDTFLAQVFRYYVFLSINYKLFQHVFIPNLVKLENPFFHY